LFKEIHLTIENTKAFGKHKEHKKIPDYQIFVPSVLFLCGL
jgi:hypothetical protein